MSIAIDAALTDQNLFGPALGDPKSWTRWLAVLRAAFGLKMSAKDRAAFHEVAGNRSPPKQRVSEFWAVVGRRSGKTRMAAAISAYIGAIERHRLAAGEVGYVLLLAASRSQASVAFSYTLSFIESSPVLKQQIESVTADEIRLRGNIIIGVHAGSYRTIRGRTLLAVVGDETSFWRDESSAQPDTEIFRACAPALAASGGMWVGISTGYRKIGLLYQKWRDHYGQDSDDVLVVQGPSTAFNKTLSLAMIERAKAADPAAAESEWGFTPFRDDIASFLSDDDIDRAIEHGRPAELPPQKKIKYQCFVDASGGRKDHYAVCVAYKDGERYVVAALRGKAPPFDPAETTNEFAALVREYGIRKVSGDNYSGEWVAQAWKANRIEYARSELNKSQIYLEVLSLFTRGIVALPDHQRLIRELRLLERRTARSGKDSVDHGQRGHDDYANATCGALRLLMPNNQSSYDTNYHRWVGEPAVSFDEQWQRNRYWGRLGIY